MPDPEDHPRVIRYRTWRGEFDPDPLTVELAQLDELEEGNGGATCAFLLVGTVAGLALILALVALYVATSRPH